MIRRTRRHGPPAALAGIAVLLAACSNGAPDPRDSEPRPSPDSPSPSTSTPSDWTPIAADATGLLTAGRLGMTANGRPDAPWAVVEVPEGFSTIGGWVVFDEDPRGGGGVGYWTVSEVVRDPCSALGDDNAIDAGSTVEDLVAALEQQELTRRTPTEPVTVDGYEGLSLELHLPKGQDFAACPAYNLWESDPAGARHMGGLGEYDKLWILDVEGEVLVLTAAVPSDTADPETAVDRMTPIVESAEFVARE